MVRLWRDITFEFGGKDVNVNVSTMPSGIQSNVASGTVTISGTPIFTNDSYTFSVLLLMGMQIAIKYHKQLH